MTINKESDGTLFVVKKTGDFEITKRIENPTFSDIENLMAKHEAPSNAAVEIKEGQVTLRWKKTR